MAKKLVSISCITYNHALYIERCLDSFLMQKTNFEFEVLIHDDCSTDGTREIIEDYTLRYPNIFFPVYQTENQYSKGIRGFSALFNFPRATGKYIAMCEGDDYWSDSNKLQKQVDYLENNNYCVLVFHNSQIKFEDSSRSSCYSVSKSYRKNFIIKFSDFLSFEYNITTSSMLFKREAILTDGKIYVPVSEKELQYYLGTKGPFFYLSDCMSVYRSHQNGVSNGITKFTATKRMIQSLNDFQEKSGFDNYRLILNVKRKLVLEYYYEKIVKTNGRVFLILMPNLLFKILLIKLRMKYLYLKLNYFNYSH